MFIRHTVFSTASIWYHSAIKIRASSPTNRLSLRVIFITMLGLWMYRTNFQSTNKAEAVILLKNKNKKKILLKKKKLFYF